MNVVLMAGGGGTRLWPLSRLDKPKQFLDLGAGKTLLEMAYERACTVVPEEKIYIATAEQYRSHIAKLLPQVADERVFYEPERRDTTAAFATVALRLQHAGYGDEPTLFMWSDHVFTNEPAFLEDLQKISPLLTQHPDSLVVMGHTPLTPETVFGYIEAGDALPGYEDVFKVQRFTEKPDRATAEQFITAGTYYWNLGYFSLRPAYLLQQLRQHSPDTIPALDAFAAALAQNNAAATTAAYSQFPKVSIEYTFVEKTPHIIAITGDYGWSDVGNWAAVYDVFGKHGDHMPRGHHMHVDSNNNYVYNVTDKAVSLIGMEDTIVVVTDDAVLITRKEDAHKVKEVVARLQENRNNKLL